MEREHMKRMWKRNRGHLVFSLSLFILALFITMAALSLAASPGVPGTITQLSTGSATDWQESPAVSTLYSFDKLRGFKIVGLPSKQ